MSSPGSRLVARAALAALVPFVSAAAQGVDARRAELDAALAKELLAFARSAATQKAHDLARDAAQLVVDRYDADSQAARRMLGQKKGKDGWQRDGSALAKDAADARGRSKLVQAWKKLRERAGQAHRELGLALRAEGADAAVVRREFELALGYLPDDRQCHEALGHEEVAGFWGDADDVALVRRLRGIVDLAAAVRDRDHDVSELAASELPQELQQMGVPMYGAKGKRYCYWSPESFAAARELVLWSERCHDLFAELLGEKAALVRAEGWRWHCVLRTPEQRDLMFEKSPSTTGPFKADQARLFAGIGFAALAGGRASATWQGANLDRDYAVANVVKRHLLDQRNDGFGEGLVHVATWLLCGTTQTYFTDLPTTVAGGFEPMPRDPEQWFERLWKEIDEGRDMPLTQVPRERPDNFRDSTRLKSWSFLFWLLARHPDQWFALIDEVSQEKLSVEQAEGAFPKVLGRSAEELEADWRRWAKRGAPMGEATGFRPKG